jgi:hypothetical protein
LGLAGYAAANLTATVVVKSANPRMKDAKNCALVVIIQSLSLTKEGWEYLPLVWYFFKLVN